MASEALNRGVGGGTCCFLGGFECEALLLLCNVLFFTVQYTPVQCNAMQWHTILHLFAPWVPRLVCICRWLLTFAYVTAASPPLFRWTDHAPNHTPVTHPALPLPRISDFSWRCIGIDMLV